MDKVQRAVLVINTSNEPFGSIEQISTHRTWREAVVAAVEYRRQNPNAYPLEIYAYNQPTSDGSLESSHSLENKVWWQLIAAEVEV